MIFDNPFFNELFRCFYLFDIENHWKECDCGHKVKTALHDYDDWKVVKEATANEKGVKERSCSVCGHTMTDEIPLLEAPDKIPDQTDNDSTLLWVIVGSTGALVAAGVIITILITKKRRASVR